MGDDIAMANQIDGLTLQDLILTLKGDRTYHQLEVDSGGVVKAQRWNQITNGHRVREFPEPRTLQAMSDALGVNVDVVVLAVARSLGLITHTPTSTLAALMPPGVENLTPDEVGAALGVIRAMLHNRTPAPPKKAPRVVGQKKKPTPGQRS